MNANERAYAVGIALLAVGARLWIAWTTHSTAEDFLITLRYAENIAQGRGFVFNPGERVLGTTTPLYTLFLALCAWLHLNAAICGKTLNILADGLSCYLLARLPARREIGLPIVGLFAALLYALSSTAVNISVGGMETALVTCAGLAAVYATVAGQSRSLLLLGAVLFLLRPDTLLLTGCLLTALVLQTRRAPWRDMGLAFLVVLPWLCFACLYFGSPVPTSLVAKLIVYAHPLMTNRSAVYSPFQTQFITGGLQRLLTVLFVIGGVRTARHKEWRLTAPLLWLLLYYGIMLTSHVPAFAWYFLPPWPLFMLFAVLGAQAIVKIVVEILSSATPMKFVALLRRTDAKSIASAGRLAERHPDRRVIELMRLAPAWQPALLLVGMFGLAHLRGVRADIAQAQELEDTVRQPIGLWLRAHVRPDERVLLEPIGTIGYYSHCRLLDMIGLVSPEVFASYHTPTPLADMTQRLRPAWLCLRPNEAQRLNMENSRLLPDHYIFIRDFRAQDGQPLLLLYRRQ